MKQGQGGAAAQKQHDDPSASWAVQQFWQRSPGLQLAQAPAAVHPARQYPLLHSMSFCVLLLFSINCAQPSHRALTMVMRM